MDYRRAASYARGGGAVGFVWPGPGSDLLAGHSAVIGLHAHRRASRRSPAVVERRLHCQLALPVCAGDYRQRLLPEKWLHCRKDEWNGSST